LCPTTHLPVATLCPRGTRIDRVAVVDAFADGEAFGDLDAHCRFEIGISLSSWVLGYWFVFESGVVDDRQCRTAGTLGTLDRKEDTINEMLVLRSR
jgi:hypothetical protein